MKRFIIMRVFIYDMIVHVLKKCFSDFLRARNKSDERSGLF